MKISLGALSKNDVGIEVDRGVRKVSDLGVGKKLGIPRALETESPSKSGISL